MQAGGKISPQKPCSSSDVPSSARDTAGYRFFTLLWEVIKGAAAEARLKMEVVFPHQQSALLHSLQRPPILRLIQDLCFQSRHYPKYIRT